MGEANERKLNELEVLLPPYPVALFLLLAYNMEVREALQEPSVR